MGQSLFLDDVPPKAKAKAKAPKMLFKKAITNGNDIAASLP